MSALPGWWAEVLVGAVMLAQRSLAQHVQAVGDALRLSLGDARSAVAMIVGRDVTGMNEAAVARAAVESAAENFSDGVIAPLFWFVLAGLPGLLDLRVPRGTICAYVCEGHHCEAPVERLEDLEALLNVQ